MKTKVDLDMKIVEGDQEKDLKKEFEEITKENE